MSLLSTFFVGSKEQVDAKRDEGKSWVKRLENQLWWGSILLASTDLEYVSNGYYPKYAPRDAHRLW